MSELHSKARNKQSKVEVIPADVDMGKVASSLSLALNSTMGQAGKISSHFCIYLIE